MGYYSNSKADTGKQVRVGPNTKGTGTRGVPTALSQMSKDKVIAAVADPEKSKPSGGASGQKGLRSVGSRRTGSANFGPSKRS